MPFSKEIIGVLVALLLAAGGYIWYVENRLTSAQEEVGALSAQNTQLTNSLESSEKAAEQTRTELTMWRELYDDLQGDFKAISETHRQAIAGLRELRGQKNVEEYVDCPMPDSVYQWLRAN